MADDIDRAQVQEALLQAAAQAYRRQEAPAPTGFCLNCGESLSQPLRWCDADCRQDWEKRGRRHA